MLINEDVECLNKIRNMCNDLEYNNKYMDEFFDDVLKELLVIRGYSKDKVYEYIDCGECMRILDDFGRKSIYDEMNRRNG